MALNPAGNIQSDGGGAPWDAPALLDEDQVAETPLLGGAAPILIGLPRPTPAPGRPVAFPWLPTPSIRIPTESNFLAGPVRESQREDLAAQRSAERAGYGTMPIPGVTDAATAISYDEDAYAPQPVYVPPAAVALVPRPIAAPPVILPEPIDVPDLIYAPQPLIPSRPRRILTDVEIGLPTLYPAPPTITPDPDFPVSAPPLLRADMDTAPEQVWLPGPVYQTTPLTTVDPAQRQTDPVSVPYLPEITAPGRYRWGWLWLLLLAVAAVLFRASRRTETQT